MQRCLSPAAAQPLALGVRLVIMAAVLLAAACATAPVGTPLSSTAAADAPTVATGDTWTYRVRDGFTGIERGTQVLHVTRATADRIEATVSTGVLDEAHVYDRSWNWLQRPGTNLPYPFSYQPSYPAFEFPLVPGKTWTTRLTATDARDGRRFPVWLKATVLGWERIRVPAGEFDAIRVQRRVVFQYWEFTVRGHADTIEDEWYAPAVKQVVRRETSGMYLSYLYGDAGQPDGRFVRVNDRNGGGPRMVPDDWFVYELASYKLR